VVKLAQYRKARWATARGMPVDWIAWKLDLSPTTVRKWRRTFKTDRQFAELRRRVMTLPAWQRVQIQTEIADSLARGWS
jgi:transposase-like protein